MSSDKNYLKEWHKRNPDKRKEYDQRRIEKRNAGIIPRPSPNYTRAKRYGLTENAVNNIVNAANGKCGICGIEFGDNRFYLDHDHITGELRDILCNKCNIGLHYIEDDEYLISSLEYLKKHNNQL